MQKFDVVTPYATYHDCFFSIEKYRADNSLALQIYNMEDGPIATMTVWLPHDSNIAPKEGQAYIDTNNCPWAEDLIEKLGVGENTELIGFSGYCIYPLYQFDMEKLVKYAS